MKIIQKPSTHYNERACSIDMIVLHATATPTIQETFYYLIEKEEQPRVSSHYVIDTDGTIYQLVADDKRAWHAGLGCWGNILEDINSHSIGIEFQCAASGTQSFAQFSDKQIQSGIDLCRELMKKYNIKPFNVVAHSDIAPDRKYDPGRTFPWELFWLNGIVDNPIRRPLMGG
ncbi:MAG: N-acetylmuramoyl-L-alanine amidase [Alphaproteobacteria bacterium]|nr:N-acetylmuramoyl-L-alanine amidase [Alphaproteobacteria bacterium]